jgi:hypothetical protein
MPEHDFCAKLQLDIFGAQTQHGTANFINVAALDRITFTQHSTDRLIIWKSRTSHCGVKKSHNRRI